MNIEFIGTGSFFLDEEQYHCAAVLGVSDDCVLLIDCPTDIEASLRKARICPSMISGVYITHLHADHVGGLEWMAFRRKFLDTHRERLDLLCHEEIMSMIWDCTLCGGMGVGEDGPRDLEDYFRTIFDMPSYTGVSGPGVELRAYPIPHMARNASPGWPGSSYGLMVHSSDKDRFYPWIIYHTDGLMVETGFWKQAAWGADWIFHDCQFGGEETAHVVWEHMKADYPAGLRAKTWLMHCIAPTPERTEEVRSAGFAGIVEPGMTFIEGESEPIRQIRR